MAGRQTCLSVLYSTVRFAPIARAPSAVLAVTSVLAHLPSTHRAIDCWNVSRRDRHELHEYLFNSMVNFNADISALGVTGHIRVYVMDMLFYVPTNITRLDIGCNPPGNNTGLQHLWNLSVPFKPRFGLGVTS